MRPSVSHRREDLLAVSHYRLPCTCSATKDTSGDSTTTTAEERTWATEDLEEHQDGRFSFAVIYTYIKDRRYPNDFSKSDKHTLRKRVKIFLPCTCRQPEYGNMISCDECSEWFHQFCINEDSNL